VIAEGGMAPHIEQMLRARKMDVPVTRRILEVNTQHPVVANLDLAFRSAKDSEDVRSWIRTLYDQALIAEGSPLDDPADFARRLTLLVQKAIASPA
jgi:molecular chaperone HtpG